MAARTSGDKKWARYGLKERDERAADKAAEKNFYKNSLIFKNRAKNG